jgi:myo-inositol-1(or 4)-monophosphatase
MASDAHTSLRPETDLAIAVALEAAAMARRGQHRILAVDRKSGPADLVSEIDRAVDEMIVHRLLTAFPRDSSLSEEGGSVEGSSGRTWVIDPVDGTHNYLAGLTHYAITIALMDGPQTVLGVIYDATDQSVHWATTAQIPVPLHEPEGPARFPVDSALVAVSLPHSLTFSGNGLRPPLDQVGDIRITGSLALDLAWTAAGRFDACLYRHQDNPWDWAAGELIAQSRGKQVRQAVWSSSEVTVVGRPDVVAVLARS